MVCLASSLDAKHDTTIEKIKIISQRVHDFPQMIKQSQSKFLDANYKKIVNGVTLFLHYCRKESLRLGFMVAYHSGSRYRVDAKNEFDYAISSSHSGSLKYVFFHNIYADDPIKQNW